MPRPILALAAVAVLNCGVLLAADPAVSLRFVEHTVATGLRGGYQVVVADLNRDGKPDLVALASGMTDLVWFENPGWERHVLASNLPRLINCVAFESNGHPAMAVASGFSNEARTSSGNVWLLEPDGDVHRPWTIREIDRLPTSHRLRLADLEGRGQPVIVNAPLTAADAMGPDYHGHTPLVYYRPGEWKRTLISDANEGVVHGVWVTDWNGDRRDEILTASFVGIHLHKLASDGRWTRTEISRGDPAPWPKGGASDLAVGQVEGRRFVCSIEPWHGNQVVVYVQEQEAWSRHVIDDSFTDGHTITTADLAGNGRDAIIAGHRGAGGGLVCYTATDKSGLRWERNPIDMKQIATAACAVADLNGDGKLDIVAIGAATANLKWYENVR